ncbi:hypothetical protein MP228_008202 [Amoeboaphelidium protococcarum]|nr:hypothetical protein MP228_008202 [Amoeboaphelidium protococcarum]
MLKSTSEESIASYTSFDSAEMPQMMFKGLSQSAWKSEYQRVLDGGHKKNVKSQAQVKDVQVEKPVQLDQENSNESVESSLQVKTPLIPQPPASPRCNQQLQIKRQSVFRNHGSSANISASIKSSSIIAKGRGSTQSSSSATTLNECTERRKIIAEWIKTEQKFLRAFDCQSEQLFHLHETIMNILMMTDEANVCRMLYFQIFNHDINHVYEKFIWDNAMKFIQPVDFIDGVQRDNKTSDKAGSKSASSSQSRSTSPTRSMYSVASNISQFSTNSSSFQSSNFNGGGGGSKRSQKSRKLSINPMARLMHYSSFLHRLSMPSITSTKHQDYEYTLKCKFKVMSLLEVLDGLVGQVRFMIQFPSLCTLNGAKSYLTKQNLKSSSSVAGRLFRSSSSSLLSSGNNNNDNEELKQISLFRDDGSRLFLRHDVLKFYKEDDKCKGQYVSSPTAIELFLFTDLLCIGYRLKPRQFWSCGTYKATDLLKEVDDCHGERVWKLQHEAICLRNVSIKLLPPIRYQSSISQSSEEAQNILLLTVGVFKYTLGFDSHRQRSEFVNMLSHLIQQDKEKFNQGNTGVDILTSFSQQLSIKDEDIVSADVPNVTLGRNNSLSKLKDTVGLMLRVRNPSAGSVQSGVTTASGDLSLDGSSSLFGLKRSPRVGKSRQGSRSSSRQSSRSNSDNQKDSDSLSFTERVGEPVMNEAFAATDRNNGKLGFFRRSTQKQASSRQKASEQSQVTGGDDKAMPSLPKRSSSLFVGKSRQQMFDKDAQQARPSYDSGISSASISSVNSSSQFESLSGYNQRPSLDGSINVMKKVGGSGGDKQVDTVGVRRDASLQM